MDLELIVVINDYKDIPIGFEPNLITCITNLEYVKHLYTLHALHLREPTVKMEIKYALINSNLYKEALKNNSYFERQELIKEINKLTPYSDIDILQKVLSYLSD